MYCWKCGDDNPSDYNFCGNCGSPARRPDKFANDNPASDLLSDISDVHPGLQTVVAKMLKKRPGSFVKSFRSSRSFTSHNENGKHVIDYQDGSGKTHTYQSADEMPTDVRREYERIFEHIQDHARSASTGSRRERKMAIWQQSDFASPPFAEPSRRKKPKRGALIAVGIVLFVLYCIFS